MCGEGMAIGDIIWCAGVSWTEGERSGEGVFLSLNWRSYDCLVGWVVH